MTNQDQLKILKSGVEKWNEWFEKESPIVDLSKENLVRLDLQNIILPKANLSRALLLESNLKNSYLAASDLSKANLTDANLSNANLEGANLSNSILTNTNFEGADLSRTNLEGANLSKANLRGANFFGANLSNANLSSANLSKSYLDSVKFLHTNLSHTILWKAEIIKADLTYANLSYANLSNANLLDSHLINTILKGANLEKAILRKLLLHYADFERVEMSGTILSEINLGNVKNINSVLVGGDCIVDIRTILDSYPPPLDFFFKIGLTDQYISKFLLLIREKPNSPTITVSYDFEDREFAIRLYESLIRKKVLVRLNELNDRSFKIHEDSFKKRGTKHKIIIPFTKLSFQTLWLREEIRWAYYSNEFEFKYHNRHMKNFIAVIIDDFVPGDWQNEIKEYMKDYLVNSEFKEKNNYFEKLEFLDFRDWENSKSFEYQLNNLIKVLDVLD